MYNTKRLLANLFSSSFRQNMVSCMCIRAHGHHTVTKKASNLVVEDTIILYVMTDTTRKSTQLPFSRKFSVARLCNSRAIVREGPGYPSN